jgi:O-methyltransferase
MDSRLLFQVIQLVIILVIFVFLIRYFWGSFLDTDYQPSEWRYRVKTGAVARALIKLEKKYPDKVRFFNFWFQIERLKREKIPGAFAELGVYRGDTARIIHLMDPSRPFHLFDTFEGLPETDLGKETGEAATYSSERFSDTTVGKVKKRINGNEMIIFHQGYFPDSTKGIEDEQFALVSIDADLYNPIAAGLNYFYPRLSPGGVIFVHDYNYKWSGAMKAVDEFAATIPESLVPVADMESTVMIIKMKLAARSL